MGVEIRLAADGFHPARTARTNDTMDRECDDAVLHRLDLAMQAFFRRGGCRDSKSVF
jgi:hypothetical protein